MDGLRLLRSHYADSMDTSIGLFRFMKDGYLTVALGDSDPAQSGRMIALNPNTPSEVRRAFQDPGELGKLLSCKGYPGVLFNDYHIPGRYHSREFFDLGGWQLEEFLKGAQEALADDPAKPIS